MWMLFGAEFWERFAYYGMRALLAVYVATAFFNLLPVIAVVFMVVQQKLMTPPPADEQPEMQQKIYRALLSDEGRTAAGALLERFKVKEFVPASSKEYLGLGVLLQDVHGFDR